MLHRAMPRVKLVLVMTVWVATASLVMPPVRVVPVMVQLMPLV